MRRRYPAMLIGLALIWGASFMFIKVAVRELTPATLILGRLGLAALTLALVVPFAIGARTTLAELRANWRWLSVVALVNTAIPFWLLSWDAVIAFGFFREVRVTGIRLAGVAVGFVGVALLVSAQPHGKVLGALAVVGMALCYGVGGLLAGRHLPSVSPLVVALGTTAVAATVALPAGVLQAPHHDPGWKVILSVVALGIPGTAIAYLLFFGMVSGVGAAFASLVTYLVPPIALAYGAVFLGERFGAAAFGGLALILGGVALGSGVGGSRVLRRRLASGV